MNNRTIFAVVFVAGLSACSHRHIIATEHYAFLPSEDSVTVSTDYATFIADASKSKPQRIVRDSTKIVAASEAPPVVLKKVLPENYPHITMGTTQGMIEGDVQVKVWLTKDGTIKRAYIVKSTNPAFNKVSLEAAMQWEFEPATIDGKPVDVWIALPFHFRFAP